MRGENVLVTGASGFLGTHLCRRLLDEKTNVTALLRKEPSVKGTWNFLDLHGCDTEICNIVDYSDVENAIMNSEPKIVYHLAAMPLVKTAVSFPVNTFDVNIKGTYNILEACRKSNSVEAVVFASSDKVYGEMNGKSYSEHMSLDAENPYDVSKVCCELLAKTFNKTYGLKVGITRCSNMYGLDMNMSRLIPYIIKQCMFGNDIALRDDGSSTRDYLHVSDAVAGYLLLTDYILNHKSYATFNFGTGQSYSVLEVFQMVRDICDSESNVTCGETSNEIKHQTLDSTLARNILKWVPVVDFEKGLKGTIDAYQRYYEYMEMFT